MMRLPLLIIFFSHLSLSDYPVHWVGKLTRPGTDKKDRVFEIIARGPSGIVGHGLTRLNGDFDLVVEMDGLSHLDLYFIDPARKSDTFFLKSFQNIKAAPPHLQLQAYARHVDDDGNVVCPKCGRSGDVNSGEASTLGYYYCDRDRTKF